jgi:ubiquinone/menaquinone biosynthesis C-methylase UbiE
MNNIPKHECIVCGSSQLLNLAPYRYKHEMFAACNLCQCQACQFVFANPMPDDKSLSNYNTSYFSNAHDGLPQDDLSVAYHSAINKLRAIYVEKNISINGVSKVLEIGGGAGYFAKYWKSKRPNTDYYMVETDTSCHKVLEELNVQLVERIEGLPGGVEFDLIVMSHVLEHTNSPFEFLSEMFKKLKKGGVIFVEVPCNDWKFKAEDEPHLLFFDKKSMKILLEKVGFKQEASSYYGESIKKLSSKSKLSHFLTKLRQKLLKHGIIFPFSSRQGDLESLENPLESAAVKPFDAHIEKKSASSWLRVIAVK